MAWLTLLGVPILFWIAFVVLCVKKQRQGLLEGAAFFFVAIAIGGWAISQSRSSTASIGLLFLPGYAAISGILAWGFGRLRADPRVPVRFSSWLLLGAAIGSLGYYSSWSR